MSSRSLGQLAGSRRGLTLVVDPRWPGGTASAVAAEIPILSRLFDLSVVGLETAMFPGREPNPSLVQSLADAGMTLESSKPVIRGETVVFHNPSCLRFNRSFEERISCDRLVVVTHENFLRPSGAQGFDVEHCLGLIEGASICRTRTLAPVSPHNRVGVSEWQSRVGAGWHLADEDWFNVIDLPLDPPSSAPRDRRGRHSRPGAEKFPPLSDLMDQFPEHAEHCAILGADSLLEHGRRAPPHWKLLPFRSVPVTDFLRSIDVFVYFTHPLWQESFGRVIAEAIAAGKLVVTDARTAKPFGDGLVVATSETVDDLVRRHLERPATYARKVRKAQRALQRYSPARFADMVSRLVEGRVPSSAVV